jgi:hypothetical protein
VSPSDALTASVPELAFTLTVCCAIKAALDAEKASDKPSDSASCAPWFSIIGLVAYFGLHRSKGALIGALAITALPFLLMNVPFWFEVAASVWRTRVGSSITSEPS